MHMLLVFTLLLHLFYIVFHLVASSYNWSRRKYYTALATVYSSNLRCPCAVLRSKWRCLLPFYAPNNTALTLFLRYVYAVFLRTVYIITVYIIVFMFVHMYTSKTGTFFNAYCTYAKLTLILPCKGSCNLLGPLKILCNRKVEKWEIVWAHTCIL